MNEAITIIQTSPIMEDPHNIINIFCIIMIISFFIAFFFACEYLAAGVICSSIIFILMLSMLFIPQVETGKKQYIIRVNDATLNLNEFLDKYVIVEHERYSNVYTVREL